LFCYRFLMVSKKYKLGDFVDYRSLFLSYFFFLQKTHLKALVYDETH
jgi:hypothetical protein